MNGDLTKRVELIHSTQNSDKRMFLDSIKVYGRSLVTTEKPLIYKFNYNAITFPFGTEKKDIHGYYSSKYSGLGIPINQKTALFDPSNTITITDRSIDENTIGYSALTEVVYPTGAKIKYNFEANLKRTTNAIQSASGLRIKSIDYYNVDNVLERIQEFYYGNLSGSVFFGSYSDYMLDGTGDNTVTPRRLYTTQIWSSEPINKERKDSGFLYDSVKVVERSSAGVAQNGMTVYKYRSFYGGYSYKPFLKGIDRYGRDGVKVRSETYVYGEGNEVSGSSWELNDMYLSLNSWTDCDGTYYGSGIGYPSEYQIYYPTLRNYRLFGIDRILKIREELRENFESEKSIFSIVDFEYNSNMLLTKQATTVSSYGQKKLQKNTYYKYIDDYLNKEDWMLDLKANSIVGRPVDVRTYLQEDGVGETLMEGNILKYTGKGLLSNIYSCNLNLYSGKSWDSNTLIASGFELSSSFTYDTKTYNLIEKTERDGLVTNYLWGYAGFYPVVKATNLSYNSLLQLVDTTAQKNIENITSSSLAVEPLMLGSENIEQLPEVQDEHLGIREPKLPPLDIPLVDGIEPSVYDEKKVIDILSTLIIKAKTLGRPVSITGYTYKTGIGISSILDANARITKYEYDSFGRLKRVIGNDGKIVSNYSYKYCNDATNGNR